MKQKSRENDIIILSAEEISNGTIEEKKKHDCNLFKSVCDYVVNDVLPVSKILRIGKKKLNKDETQTSKSLFF